MSLFPAWTDEPHKAWQQRRMEVYAAQVDRMDQGIGRIVDALRENGIDAFGPDREGARLEGSKVFSKEFMARHAIPTAGFAVFDDPDEAEAYVRQRGEVFVVKADGLALGKGVVVPDTVAQTIEAIDRIGRRKELGSAIQTALAELPEHHRAVIVLREIEGMSYEEMADALEVPKGTVMSRLFHARKKMQAALAPYLGAEEASED